MDIKAIKPTDLRPEGGRIINAPLVRINIPESIRQLKAEVTWHTSDRNAITVFKSDGMCIVVIALRRGAAIKNQTAQEITSLQVIEGAVNFTTDSESLALEQHDVVAINAGLSHSIEASEESVIVLTLIMLTNE